MKIVAHALAWLGLTNVLTSTTPTAPPATIRFKDSKAWSNNAYSLLDQLTSYKFLNQQGQSGQIKPDHQAR